MTENTQTARREYRTADPFVRFAIALADGTIADVWARTRSHACEWLEYKGIPVAEEPDDSVMGYTPGEDARPPHPMDYEARR